MSGGVYIFTSRFFPSTNLSTVKNLASLPCFALNAAAASQHHHSPAALASVLPSLSALVQYATIYSKKGPKVPEKTTAAEDAAKLSAVQDDLHALHKADISIFSSTGVPLPTLYTALWLLLCDC